MKIPCYVIMGSVGMYSDWTTWPVKIVFGSPEEAEAEAVRIQQGMELFMTEQVNLGRSYTTIPEDERPKLDTLDPTSTWINSHDTAHYEATSSFVELSDLELLNNIGLQMMEESARLENIQHSLS